MTRSASLLILLAVFSLACGRPIGPTGSGVIPVPAVPTDAEPRISPLVVHPNAIAQAYTDNPASADEKFKGKLIETKMPWLQMGRENGKTIIRSGLVVYRFASEGEAAKVQPSTLYRVRGRCEGLSGQDLVIADVRIVGEWSDEWSEPVK